MHGALDNFFFFFVNSWLEKAAAALVCQWEVPRLLFWDGCRVTAKNSAFLSLLGIVSILLYSKIIPSDFTMLEKSISNIIGFIWATTKEKQKGHITLSWIQTNKVLLNKETADIVRFYPTQSSSCFHLHFLHLIEKYSFQAHLKYSFLQKCGKCIYGLFSHTLKIFLKVAFILKT